MEIKATRLQIEEFSKSLLWLDIVEELDDWAKGFEEELRGVVDDIAENNPSTVSVLTHLGDINGRIKTVEYMKGILEMFLSVLDYKQQRKDEKEEVENGQGE